MPEAVLDKTDVVADPKEPESKDPSNKNDAQHKTLPIDVRKAVEAGKQEEKDKLYSQMQKMEEKIKSLTAQLEESKKQFEVAQSELGKTKTEKEATEKTVDEKLQVIHNQIKTQYEAEKQQLTDRIGKLEIQIKEKEVNELRTRLIKEATRDGSVLIDELVKGETQADILASIAEAKQKAEGYAQLFRAKQVNPPPPAAPGMGTVPLSGKSIPELIAVLAETKDDKKRAAIRREIFTLEQGR